jgi:DNA (cytosine-5)-methyltransferase 1
MEGHVASVEPLGGVPTVLSLFTGLGGLDLGLESAGFRNVGCIEIDEVARRSLKANRGDAWIHLEPHDVTSLARTLQPSDLGLGTGELDVLAGAPPCQPFSKAAQWTASGRLGAGDDRGVLVFDVLDLARTLQPKLVLLENVAGFTRGPASVLPLLRGATHELSTATGHRYELEAAVLDAHEHGVAQHRRRAIVVISRVGPISWPEPLSAEDRPVAWDAIGNLREPDPNLPRMVGSYASLLPSIPEGCNYQWHTERGGGMPLFGYRTRYWSFLLKLAKAKPSWTIAAQPGPSTGPFHWESRPLSVREMLRLQSFPDDWIVEGTRVEEVRQIGNATPPALAERLGIEIRACLGYERGVERLAIGRNGLVPPAEPVEAVPAAFERLVRAHAAHPGAGKGPRPRSTM